MVMMIMQLAVKNYGDDDDDCNDDEINDSLCSQKLTLIRQL